jgi:hypothetical protein
MLPSIPAVEYNTTIEAIKSERIDELQLRINECLKRMQNVDFNQMAEKIKQSDREYFTQIAEEGMENSLPRTNFNFLRALLTLLWKIFVRILGILLNLALIMINMIGSAIKVMFGLIVNFVNLFIQGLLNLGKFLSKVLDILAIIIKGIFTLLINTAIEILAIIKNIILELLTPQNNY